MRYLILLLTIVSFSQVKAETIDLNLLDVTDGQPYFHFIYQDQDYLIYAWLDDDSSNKQMYTACIAIPRLNTDTGRYTAYNVECESATDYYIDQAGDMKSFMNNVFLPTVNSYLESMTVGDIKEFPIDLAYWEQFNWIVENKLYFDGQKVKMQEF